MERIGRRLREIREVYGYSIEEVSEKIGVSKENVERVERGEEPEEVRFLDVVQRYARVFKLNPMYLFDPDFRYPKVNFRTRYIGPLEKEQIQKIIGFIYLVSSFYYDVTDEKLPELPYYPVNIERLYTGEDDRVALAKALEVIRKLKENEGVDSLETALYRLKIYVLEVNLFEKLDGFSVYVPGVTLPVIVINKKHSICRKRFTLAHELMHLLSDFKHGFPPLAEDKFFMDEIQDDEIRCRETVANKFAQYLLVPFEEVEKIRNFDRHTKRELMERYCVSEKVIDYIAKDLGKRTGNFDLTCPCRKTFTYPDLAELYRRVIRQFEDSVLHKEYASVVTV